MKCCHIACGDREREFLGETRIGFQYSFVRSFYTKSARSSNISKTVWARITKFYSHIHIDIVYSRAGYDVMIYFRSEVIGENSRIYRFLRLRVEFLDNGSIQDHEVSHAYRRQVALRTCPKWRQQLIPVACKMLLNTTEMCGKRVRNAEKGL